MSKYVFQPGGNESLSRVKKLLLIIYKQLIQSILYNTFRISDENEK